MISTQFDAGKPEWQGEWTSNAHASFQPTDVAGFARVKRNLNKGEICIGDQPISYVSATKGSFNGPPSNYVPAKPLRDRQELTATNYKLGTDNIEYKTAAQQQFAHPKKVEQKLQPKFKNYNERVDIITGTVKNQNARSYPFEGFSEEMSNRASQNKAQLPQDLCLVDPITNRTVMRVHHK